MVGQEALKSSYDDVVGTAERFRSRLLQEIEELLRQVGVVLAIPIESRVKTFDSVQQKIRRLELSCQTASELDDLVGLRLILLFKRDVDSVCHALAQTFDILRTEDTGIRLGQTEFGYQSIHIQLQAPAAWRALPSFALFSDLTAEVQVRTISQHAWAAASHVLQYKHEAAIPAPVRRSIHRVSAFLETVDLELERVLVEREDYAREIDQLDWTATLDVDVLDHTLNNNLPVANRTEAEDYSSLLTELNDSNITTVGDLQAFLDKFKDRALEADSRILAVSPDINWTGDETTISVEGMYYQVQKSRFDEGVFFSYVGLVREMLEIAEL